VFDEPKGINKGNLNIEGHDILKRIYDTEQVGPTANTYQGGNLQIKVFASKGRCYVKGTVKQNYESVKMELQTH
jgi:hypothetical protein